MSSKPVYKGTYAEYERLPREVKQYYDPPIQAPEGYEYHSSRIYTSQPLPENPAMRTGEYKSPQEVLAIKTYEEVTFVPTFENVQVAGNAALPRKITPLEAQRAQAAYLRGEQPFTSMEQQATLRLTAATTVAAGVTTPAVGAVGLGAVGIAEGVKVVTVQRHLTPEEAVGAAAVGVAVASIGFAAAKALQPRVQRNVDASYRQAVDNIEVYKPSTVQRVAMRTTGAKVPRLAQEVVSSGEPEPLSFSMLEKGNVVSKEASYFWDVPSPRSSEVYVRGYSPTKSWVDTTLVKRVYLEGLFTQVIPTRLEIETAELEPKMPYIPKEDSLSETVSVSAKPSLYNIAVLGVQQPNRLVSRLAQRQELLAESAQESITRQAAREEQAQSQRQGQRQLITQQVKLQESQIQKQEIKELPATNLVSVSAPKIAVSDFVLSGGGGRGWGLPNIRLARYNRVTRVYPIKLPKKVWEDFL